MNTQWTPAPPDELRDAAEAALARSSPRAERSRTPTEVLHELQVHQIELEMQNESLRAALIAQEESNTRYVDLFDFAPVGYLTLSHAGQITAINLTGATLLQEERARLLLQHFDRFVTAEDREAWLSHLRSAFEHGAKETCELKLQRNDGTTMVARLDCLRAMAEDAQPTLRVTLTDVTERWQAVAQWRAANEQLASLAARQAAHLRELGGELTHAEQRERDRLYDLLHDEVQPLLVAARWSLSSLGANTARQEALRAAAEACGHITKVLQVARNLSLQLSPPLIRECGLGPALESLCDWVKTNYGLEAGLTRAPEAEVEDMAMRLICFNAVRELLLNVIKHAATTRVTVTLQLVADDTLCITVADHGRGFDPAAVADGSGLNGIARRLGMLGGKLKIDSRPGAGTSATLSAPLRPKSWLPDDHSTNG